MHLFTSCAYYVKLVHSFLFGGDLVSLLRWENNEDSPASPLPQPLKLLYFSTAKYEHDWHCTLHTHQCIEIFYIVKGSGSFRVEDASFSIAHDDVVVINSGVAHTEVSSAHDPLEYIVLGISGNDFLLGGQQDQRYCILTDLSATRPLLPYLKNISLEITQKKAHYQNVVQHIFHILAIQLLRSQSAASFTSKSGNVNPKCAQIKRYIDNHYKENVTVDTLASVAFLSRSYLIHIFTKEYGEPPISYLTKRRIEESRYLLAKTDYSILEIGLMVGFTSGSYFSQSFRRLEGISPKEYRRRAQAEAFKEVHQSFDYI